MNIRKYAYLCTHNYADMVKLVDMPDLGSGAARRVGSSPIIRTEKASEKSEAFFVLQMVLSLVNNVANLCRISCDGWISTP